MLSLCKQAVKGRKMGFAHYSGSSAVSGLRLDPSQGFSKV